MLRAHAHSLHGVCLLPVRVTWCSPLGVMKGRRPTPGRAQRQPHSLLGPGLLGVGLGQELTLASPWLRGCTHRGAHEGRPGREQAGSPPGCPLSLHSTAVGIPVTVGRPPGCTWKPVPHDLTNPSRQKACMFRFSSEDLGVGRQNRISSGVPQLCF